MCFALLGIYIAALLLPATRHFFELQIPHPGMVLAFSAVLGSLGLSQLASHVFHASDATQSVMLLMGMAVGVDYSLFYLKREREERAAGHRGHEGLFRAAGTSGQAVLVSGCTVLIAMAGMLFAGSTIFVSIGVGAMIVVFTALAGSLTVLPAMLGKLGDRVERGPRQVLAASVLRVLRPLRAKPHWLVWLREQPTLLRRLKGERQESRAWGFVLKRSMRFPVIATALSTGLLVVLALPVLGMHTKLLSFTDLPKSLGIVKTYDTIQRSFPGSADPAHLVVKAKDVTTPQILTGVAESMRQSTDTVESLGERVEHRDVVVVGGGHSRPPARFTSRSGRGRRPCRSTSSVVTSSGISRRPGSSTSRTTPGSAADSKAETP